MVPELIRAFTNPTGVIEDNKHFFDVSVQFPDGSINTYPNRHGLDGTNFVDYHTPAYDAAANMITQLVGENKIPYQQYQQSAIEYNGLFTRLPARRNSF